VRWCARDFYEWFGTPYADPFNDTALKLSAAPHFYTPRDALKLSAAPHFYTPRDVSVTYK